MKKVLFDAIAQIGSFIVTALNNVGDWLATGIKQVFGFVVWIVANLTRFCLFLIDRDRIDHAEQVIEQYTINKELEILGAVSHVKEDALANSVWTSRHSAALNILGNRLFQECDWEEDRIHDYMRRVVESIPGLGYAVGVDDDEDDEEEGISIS